MVDPEIPILEYALRICRQILQLCSSVAQYAAAMRRRNTRLPAFSDSSGPRKSAGGFHVLMHLSRPRGYHGRMCTVDLITGMFSTYLIGQSGNGSTDHGS